MPTGSSSSTPILNPGKSGRSFHPADLIRTPRADYPPVPNPANGRKPSLTSAPLYNPLRKSAL